jgi:hypothetical protein
LKDQLYAKNRGIIVAMHSDPIAVALWIIATGATSLVIGLGIILSYHWVRFAMSKPATISAIIVYTLVSAALVLALFGAAASYSL